MEQSRGIMHVFIQGAAYGFEKGFESNTEYLRTIVDITPDETAKKIVKALIAGLERNFGDARTAFQHSLEVAAAEMDAQEGSMLH